MVNDLGIQITRARHSAKLTLSELANRCGISSQELQEIEKKPDEYPYGLVNRVLRELSIHNYRPPRSAGNIMKAFETVDSGRIVKRANRENGNAVPYYKYYDVARESHSSCRGFLLDILCDEQTDFSQNTGHIEDSITVILKGSVTAYWIDTSNKLIKARLNAGTCYHSLAFVPHSYLKTTPEVDTQILSFTFNYCLPIHEIGLLELARKISAPSGIEEVRSSLSPTATNSQHNSGTEYQHISSNDLHPAFGLQVSQNLSALFNAEIDSDVAGRSIFKPENAPLSSVECLQLGNATSSSHQFFSRGRVLIYILNGNTDVSASGSVELDTHLRSGDSIQLPPGVTLSLITAHSVKLLVFTAPSPLSFLENGDLKRRLWSGMRSLETVSKEWARGQE